MPHSMKHQVKFHCPADVYDPATFHGPSTLCNPTKPDCQPWSLRCHRPRNLHSLRLQSINNLASPYTRAYSIMIEQYIPPQLTSRSNYRLNCSSAIPWCRVSFSCILRSFRMIRNKTFISTITTNHRKTSNLVYISNFRNCHKW
jgi:hypothetical protein